MPAAPLPDQHLMAAKIAEIAATADQYPGVIIIHNIRTSSVEYMSERGLSLLRTSLAELRAMGPAYHSRFFNQEESAEYVPKVWHLLQQNDPDQLVTLFQQVRTTQSPNWSWYLSTMKLLLRGDDGQPLLLICFACPIDPASHITAKVARLLEENNFLRRHHHQFSQLTSREREVLKLQALGKSTAEIAAALFISVQTAQTHRRNIKQKLAPESAFELAQYARAFNLI